VDTSEREETTKYAKRMIDFYLKNKEYATALLLSSIYVHIRLKSLLTDRLNPPKDKWKKVSSTRLDFRPALNLCKNLEILSVAESQELGKLWSKRCKIAHESSLWREPSEKDINEIKRFCESAKHFLEITTNKP